ncbi:MAG: SDR family oxidoreductase [Chitinophagaceae bacterium]|nr:SDR family oxidoreductase [Chitinophagaceae bacterium]
MNILITGGSKGIGKAVAEKFAANGYTIFICARNETELASTAKEISEKYGAKVFYKAFDVSNKKELKALAAWVLNEVSSVDVLINNAGSFVPGRVHEEEDGSIEFLMETNVYSAYYLTKYLLPPMMQKRSGHIFNMSSIASLKAYEAGGSYSITKFALNGLTVNLRDELKEYGIKVTSVMPGAVYTDSWSSSGLPESRFIAVKDIAELIYTAATLSPQACVEEIVIRPQLGDI